VATSAVASMNIAPSKPSVISALVLTGCSARASVFQRSTLKACDDDCTRRFSQTRSR
jgi:hypothetical protein